MTKYSKLPRIYINQEINILETINLEYDIFHYIKSVLRLKLGDSIRVFNENMGEFFANIISYNADKCSIRIIKQYRTINITNNSPKITLALCIIKHKNMIEAIRNAVQLGVYEIFPIISERVQFSQQNIERINKAIIESSEQSERLSIPKFKKSMKLKDFLAEESRQIIFANETESYKTLSEIRNIKEEVVALIGPEGGFTNDEINMIKNIKQVISISLSENILRSDTAVSALISSINLIFTQQ